METVLASISLFSSANGLLLGIIILTRFGSNARALYLGALLVCASSVIGLITLEHQHWVPRRPWVYISEESLSLIYGPLLLLFVCSSINRKLVFRYKALLFLPLMIYLGLVCQRPLIASPDYRPPLGMENIMWLQIAFFVVAVIFYWQWRRQNKHLLLKKHQISIAYILACILIIHLSQIARWLFTDWPPLRDVVPITSTLFFFLFLVYALLHSRSLKDISEMPPEVDKDKTRQLYTTLLEKIAAERPYLDTDLTIQQLATSVDTSVAALRQSLQQWSGQGFYEFINQYRLAEAKKLLRDPDEQRYTIEGIARQCGFASRSAFYKAFKIDTGDSPAEYRRKHLSG